MATLEQPDPEWTDARRENMRRLEAGPRVVHPPSLLKQRELREKVARGELTEYPSEEVEDFGG